jgi:autotransporter adhesin
MGIQGGGSNYYRANSTGPAASATGTNALAMGPSAVSSGDDAIAIGDNAQATKSGSIAVGLNAASTGANAIAIGTGAVATGSIAVGNTASASNGGAAFGDFANATCPTCTPNISSATAVGNSASATVANGVAVGQSATVAAANGTAIGAGATVQAGATNAVAVGQGSVASAPNSVSFGSPGSLRTLTNVAPGVNPTDVATFGQLSSVASGVQQQIGSVETQIGGLQTQVNQANSGVAMAMAMGGGFLPDNKRFAVAANYGAFAGQGALGLTGLARLSDSIVLSGSFGYSVVNSSNEYGGRVGVQFAW